LTSATRRSSTAGRDACAAERHRVGARNHGRTHRGTRQRIADSDRAADDELRLEFGNLFGCEAILEVAAETRVEAVDRPLARRGAFHHGACRQHALSRLIGQRNVAVAARNARESVDVEVVARQDRVVAHRTNISGNSARLEGRPRKGGRGCATARDASPSATRFPPRPLPPARRVQETPMTDTFNRRDFLTGVAGTALAYAIDAPAQTASAPRTNITVRIDRDLAVLDPAARTGPWDGNVIRCVHQRLMKQKPNSSELELDAAADVKQVSPTVIEFRLKPNQMFTDGFGEMTAEDVKFSFERIGLPAKDAVATYKNDWLYLTGVEVKSKYEGRIVLSQPRANLFDVVIGDVSGCIVSKKAVEQRGADIATKPVGSGPYQVVSLERQKGATLRRNPAYAGKKPHYEEIAIRFISDARTTDLALRSGELDFAVLSPSAAEPLRAVSGLTLNEQPSIAYVWLGMNVEKAPFNDIRVRQPSASRSMSTRC
jgi:hypothetical protein